MKDEINQLDAENERDVIACFTLFKFLRPHLDERGFIEQVRQQAHEGYRIAYIQRDGEIIAACGYRVMTFLAWGKVLYIDDLITHPERKRSGMGSALLDWLLDRGKQLGCNEVHLDTGHQRHDAHRLYLNKGFVLSCHHMSVKIN